MTLSAADCTLLAPDGIVPLIGYRLWKLAEARGHRMLVSMNGDVAIDVSIEDPWLDQRPRWLTARCLSGRRALHPAPAEGCTCGFYAVKSLFTLGAMFAFSYQLREDGDPIMVGGRVEMAGKVIEHDLGYRVERIRIAELLPFEGSEHVVGRFARRVGVHVGTSIPMGSVGSATPVPSPIVLNYLSQIRRSLESGSGRQTGTATPAGARRPRSSDGRAPSSRARPPRPRRPGENDPGVPAA